ncbi:phage holin family protein [Thalassospira marina]|uniref:Phage holin family protein n=1 Tax=Thalassospira marina TaxID=2048283 RepID=A0A2N3KYC2_9PROT|nr:phage holin family protein [Thalassospira marina]PKR55562.1 hypothetical protein COO20_05220 [Thalassospira marina]
MIDQLIEAIGDMAQAAAARLAAIAMIGLVILVGAGFLLAAVYMGLAAHFGPIVSALTIGIVLIVLGLVACAIWFGKSPTFEREEEAQQRRTPRTEDDIIMDLLVDAAQAGFATGQGDKRAMHQGFERILQDLDGLGAFERQQQVADAIAKAEAAQEAAMRRAAEHEDHASANLRDSATVGPQPHSAAWAPDMDASQPFPRGPGQDGR